MSSAVSSLRRPPRGMQRRRPTVYGCRGSRKTSSCGALLDEAAGVEDADALAHLRDDREVVADEEDARPELLAQRGDEVEHLRLDRRVEAGRRLVEDEERRVLRERHRDDDALLHTARELVRIAAHHPLSGRRSAPCAASPRSGAAPPPWRRRELEYLGELRPDPDRRVQGRGGVLVDHRERRRLQPAHLPAAHGEHVLAVQADRAALRIFALRGR